MKQIQSSSYEQGTYMTMVDISRLRGCIERIRRIRMYIRKLHNDLRHVSGMHLVHILPSFLIRFYTQLFTTCVFFDMTFFRIIQLIHTFSKFIYICYIRLIQNSKQPKMNMQRVIILRQINHIPYLRRPHLRFLGYRIIIRLRVNIQMNRLINRTSVLVHSNVTRLRHI
ncbi:hypothetical protein Hanom_Chr17g01563091 [Helianthus anomalus]